MTLNLAKRVSILILTILSAGLIKTAVAAPELQKPFFGESIYNEQLQKRYDRGDKIKILIVPGHDEKTGAEFKGVREADLNLNIAEKLNLLFNLDQHFQTFITRDKNGFNKELAEYLSLQKAAIIEFRNRHRESMKTAVKQGFVEKILALLGTYATRKESIKLYGINKWANENNIDIVINLHFNDDPLRKRSRKGKFSGFSISVPEKQLPNSKISKLIAESVYSKLIKLVPPSNMPLEKDGIIENQELIALGANASLKAGSLLIEYGYIYEPQFHDPVIRPLLNGELALQTYQGIKNFFDPNTKIFKHNSFLLPYEWKNWLGKDLKNNKDVFALQLALIQENLYPPKGFRCSINGNFDECTEVAVYAFQKKRSLDTTDFIDTPTLNKLNALYGE